MLGSILRASVHEVTEGYIVGARPSCCASMRFAGPPGRELSMDRFPRFHPGLFSDPGDGLALRVRLGR